MATHNENPLTNLPPPITGSTDPMATPKPEKVVEDGKMSEHTDVLECDHKKDSQDKISTLTEQPDKVDDESDSEDGGDAKESGDVDVPASTKEQAGPEPVEADKTATVDDKTADSEKDADGEKDKDADGEKDKDADGEKDKDADGEKDKDADGEKDKDADGEKSEDDDSDSEDSYCDCNDCDSESEDDGDNADGEGKKQRKTHPKGNAPYDWRNARYPPPPPLGFFAAGPPPLGFFAAGPPPPPPTEEKVILAWLTASAFQIEQIQTTHRYITPTGSTIRAPLYRPYMTGVPPCIPCKIRRETDMEAWHAALDRAAETIISRRIRAHENVQKRQQLEREEDGQECQSELTDKKDEVVEVDESDAESQTGPAIKTPSTTSSADEGEHKPDADAIATAIANADIKTDEPLNKAA